MASVDWRKHHSNSNTGAAMIGHMARHDDREGVAYSNPDVDPSRSGENYTLAGPETAGAGLDAAGVTHALQERMAALDAEHPPQRIRADRVTLVTLVVPAPAGLTSEQERDFFRHAYGYLARSVGGQANCSPGYVHRDEIHEYVRNGEIRQSRAHMHMAVIPYTNDHGINGKAFVTRERMQRANRQLDQLCRQRYGVRYLTGETPGRKHTEQLKIESIREADALLAMRQQQVQQYTHITDEARTAAEHAVQRAQDGLDALKRAEAEEIPTRTHTRGIGANKHATVEIPAEEYDRLRDGAAVAESNRLWVDRERQRAREALQKAQEHAQELERSTLGLQMQIAAKTSELDAYRRRWERVPEEVRQEVEHELSRGRSRSRSR